MINKKSRDEIKRMRHAGHIVALVHQEMKKVVEPGISTKELDNIAMKVIKANKAIPTFLGYNGFPACICTSINEQVVHGIPSDYALKAGDVVSVDCGTFMKGFYGDSAYTFAVGEIDPKVAELLKVTKEALYKGVAQAFQPTSIRSRSSTVVPDAISVPPRYSTTVPATGSYQASAPPLALAMTANGLNGTGIRSPPVT